MSLHPRTNALRMAATTSSVLAPGIASTISPLISTTAACGALLLGVPPRTRRGPGHGTQERQPGIHASMCQRRAACCSLTVASPPFLQHLRSQPGGVQLLVVRSGTQAVAAAHKSGAKGLAPVSVDRGVGGRSCFKLYRLHVGYASAPGLDFGHGDLHQAGATASPLNGSARYLARRPRRGGAEQPATAVDTHAVIHLHRHMGTSGKEEKLRPVSENALRSSAALAGCDHIVSSAVPTFR